MEQCTNQVTVLIEILKRARIGFFHPNLIDHAVFILHIRDIKVSLPTMRDVHIELEINVVGELINLLNIQIYLTKGSINLVI